MTQPKIEGVGHGVPRMLYANDGSNWYAILVDSDGHVKIDVVAYPGSNALGNFPFGYYDRYAESSSDTNPGAGTIVKYLSTVPAGEVWVIGGIGAKNVPRIATIEFDLFDGTDAYVANHATMSAANTWLMWTGELVLKAGDKLRIVFFGTTAGDDLEWVARGYKMKVA